MADSTAREIAERLCGSRANHTKACGFCAENTPIIAAALADAEARVRQEVDGALYFVGIGDPLERDVVKRITDWRGKFDHLRTRANEIEERRDGPAEGLPLYRDLISDALAKSQAEVSALSTRLAAVEQALREYGRHTEGCSAMFGPEYRCRCGFNDVSAALGDTQ